MTEPHAQEHPRTIGELRRRLAEMGNPWTVDPQLSDDEPIRDRPRGGQAEAEVPEELRLAAVEPSRDLGEVLAEQPPANPALRERWAQEGLLRQDDGRGEGG
jgi:hypothetical protein